VTAPLINIAGLGSGAIPRPTSPAAAILATEGSAPLLRFGETLRAQTSEGGLLATQTVDADLQIDDADILRQLSDTNANAAAVARTRATVGAADAQIDDSNATGDDDATPVSWIPLVSTGLELPSVPVTAAPANATAMAGAASSAASPRDVDPIALVATPLRASRGAGSVSPTTFSTDGVSDTSVENASAPRPAPITRVLLSTTATATSDPQASNLLISQSQPLLMSLASGATDATVQNTVGADKAADAPPAVSNRPALVDALGERLSVQLNRGSSQATIRLDPPMMGTIEIVIRHDAAGVQVHLSATHGDVLRQLHSIGNALSQDLVQRNHGDVTVHVSEGSREGDGRQRNRQGGSADAEATPGHALRTTDEPERAPAFTLA
jgi:flagellar hook-length control protein FliK